jgi:hypothetical protein
MRGSFIDRLLLPAVVGLAQYWLRYLWQRQLTGQRATIRAARKAPSWFVKNKLQSAAVVASAYSAYLPSRVRIPYNE